MKSWLTGLFRFHPRLWISAFVGLVLFFCLPMPWPYLTRLLIAWNAGVALFIVLVIIMGMRLSADDLHSRYADEDESASFILGAVILAAALSLVAIVDPLASLRSTHGAQRIGHFALAMLTLVNSWVLVPIMFTTHYADMFYSSGERRRPLNFPDTQLPLYLDFAYFSFTIAAACQTSDVSTAQGEIRKIVLAQTLISFLFNASILGFAINVTAGLIGGS